MKVSCVSFQHERTSPWAAAAAGSCSSDALSLHSSLMFSAGLHLPWCTTTTWLDDTQPICQKEERTWCIKGDAVWPGSPAHRVTCSSSGKHSLMLNWSKLKWIVSQYVWQMWVDLTRNKTFCCDFPKRFQRSACFQFLDKIKTFSGKFPMKIKF